MQCAYFCVQLSEAIIGRSSIIQDQTIQTKYSATTRCVLKHIYNNIYGLINETGLYNRNKVLSFVIYNPIYFTNFRRITDERVARVRYSPEISELSMVINHKTEDFISIFTLQAVHPAFFGIWRNIHYLARPMKVLKCLKFLPLNMVP